MGRFLSELGDDRLGIALTFYTSDSRLSASAFRLSARADIPRTFFFEHEPRILVLNDLLGFDRERSAQNIEAERVAGKILLDRDLACIFAGFVCAAAAGQFWLEDALVMFFNSALC
jgi:hypothetical protein